MNEELETALPDEPLADESALEEVKKAAEEAEKDSEEENKEEAEEKEEKDEEKEEETDEKDDENEEEKPKRKRPGKNARIRMRLEAENKALKAALERAPEPPPLEEPKQDNFDTLEDFLVAKAKYEVRMDLRKEQEEQVTRQRQQQTRTQADELKARIDEQIETGREKYEDFDDVVLDPDVLITETMAYVIAGSDLAPDVAYHIAKNPKEARRIAALDPLGVAREIGKIEQKLSVPAPKKATNAPPPVTRVTKGGSPNRDPERMSYEEYRAMRLKKG